MSACDELLRGFAWDRSLTLFDVLLMAAWAARNADLIWGESGGKFCWDRDGVEGESMEVLKV